MPKIDSKGYKQLVMVVLNKRQTNIKFSEFTYKDKNCWLASGALFSKVFDKCYELMADVELTEGN